MKVAQTEVGLVEDVAAIVVATRQGTPMKEVLAVREEMGKVEMEIGPTAPKELDRVRNLGTMIHS